VTLRICGVSGELVTTLLDEECGTGQHVARWDGRDASGAATSSGIYFARLESSGTSKTLKMVRLH
jgi:flagellar hook assembly protein FlgD